MVTHVCCKRKRLSHCNGLCQMAQSPSYKLHTLPRFCWLFYTRCNIPWSRTQKSDPARSKKKRYNYTTVPEFKWWRCLGKSNCLTLWPKRRGLVMNCLVHWWQVTLGLSLGPPSAGFTERAAGVRGWPCPGTEVEVKPSDGGTKGGTELLLPWWLG